MKKDGGPAFPRSAPQGIATPGMSLLDYFAGRALQGVLSAPGCPGNAAQVSKIAYDFAECMLRERERRMKEK